jgi:hypothetical protein
VQELERPTQKMSGRHRRRLTIGGEGVAAILFAGVLVALAVLRDDSEPLGFEPSPSPTASQLTESPTPTPPAPELSPSETPNVTPTPVPVAEPTATPESNAPAVADLPPGILPPESLVRVALDGVRMREEPSTDAPVVAKLAAGEIVHLTWFGSGVRDEEGHLWYAAQYVPGYDGWPVRPPQQSEPDSGYRNGYVALGTPEQPFFELVEPRCPGGEPDLAALLRITDWERLACYGDRSLTLQGTIGCPGCGPAISPGRWQPEWLASPGQLSMIYPSVAAFNYFDPVLALNFNPDSAGESPPGGTIIRLTGHYDDPQARNCEMAPGEGDYVVQVDPALAELWCRLRFVVERYEVIGTDPDW